jgi:hypothetical protein
VAITSFTQAQITAGSILFVADGGEAAPNFDVMVSDGAKTDGPTAAIVAFTNLNDAPSMGDATLAATNEDSSHPPGADVTALFGPAFSDPDSLMAGIVIVGNTANPTTQGVWQFSSDGVTWADISSADDSNGLVVKADSLIRFLPALNFNGSPDDLVVRGLDHSYTGPFSVTAGTEVRETIDTSSPTSSSPYSMVKSVLKTSVDPVNDAPTLSSHSITVISGVTFASSAGVFNALSRDVDGDGLAAAFFLAPAHGTFVLAANGSFIYTSTSGFVGSDTIGWRAFDGTSFSADAMITITVNAGGVVTTTPDPDPAPTPGSDPDPNPDPGPTPDPALKPELEPVPTTSSTGPTGGPNALLPPPEDDDEEMTMMKVLSSQQNVNFDQARDFGSLKANRVTLESTSQKYNRTTRSYDPRLTQLDFTLMSAPGAMWDEMDAMGNDIESHLMRDLMLAGSANVATSGLIAGAVVWAFRSGLIVSGLLANLPAWQTINPLLVMQSVGSEDDETLEEMMERESESLG